MVSVDITDEHDNTQTRIIKTYDHRFAADLRWDYGLKPYSTRIEQEYRNYIAEGQQAKSFLNRLHEYEARDEEFVDESCTDAEDELFLRRKCAQMYNAEVAAYDRLKPLQGDMIPRFFGTACIPDTQNNSETVDNSSAQHNEISLDIPCIVLEYTPSFSLDQIIDNAPQDAWQGIVDQAADIVRTYNDYDILNEDVRMQNFIVERMSQERYQVRLIDLAMCKLRSELDSDDV